MNDDQLRKLKGKLLPTEDWASAPENIQRIAQENADTQVPTGLAFDADWGWCVVLFTAAGPQLAYSQRGPDRQFLRAEEGELKRMLADREPGDIIGTMSLESRLATVQEELKR